MNAAASRLALIGAGNMGRALLSGWMRAGGETPARDILVIDPDQAARDRVEALGARTAARARGADMEERDTVVLAVKPQGLDVAAGELVHLLAPGVLIISILAGVRLETLKSRFPRAHVLRAVPNTPATLGAGITAFTADERVTDGQRERAIALMESAGEVVEAPDEAALDAVTAVSGSGPAFVYLFAEELALAGEAEGLPPELSRQLANATVAGAGALMAQPDAEPASLRDAVTSPGGTTEAGLKALQFRKPLRKLVTKAVAAAAQRSRELGG